MGRAAESARETTDADSVPQTDPLNGETRMATRLQDATVGIRRRPLPPECLEKETL